MLDFLSSMVEDDSLLWKIVSSTKNKTFDEVKYSGGNAATLLGRLQQSFVKRNLKGTVLAGADLTNTDLSKANLSGADLSGATLTHTVLDRADLRDANLSNISIKELNPIISLTWSPDGQTLAAAYSNYKLRLWSATDWGRWREVASTAKRIRSLCWDSTGRKLYVSCNGGVGLIQLDKSDQFSLFEVDGNVGGVSIDCEDRLLAIKRSKPYKKAVTMPSRKETVRPTFFLRKRFRDILLLEAESGKLNPIITPQGDFNYPTVLCFSHENNLLYSGKYNGGIQVYDRNGKRWGSRKIFSEAAITAMAVGPGGIVVCGSNHGEIDVLNQRLQSVRHPAADQLKYKRPDQYRGKILQIEINKQTGYIAILSKGGLNIWDQEGKEILSVSPETDIWSSISFDPTGTLLAVAVEATIHIFDLRSTSPSFGKCLNKLGREFSCAGMLIDKTKGLQATAPTGKGKLGDWLKDRGAILKE